MRGDIGALRRAAEKLRALNPDAVASSVSERAASEVGEAAKRAYPADHVRTGATLRSITGSSSGPNVVVTAETPYARFVEGIFDGVEAAAEQPLDTVAQRVLDEALEGS